jgi:hypothetical protein
MKIMHTMASEARTKVPKRGEAPFSYRRHHNWCDIVFIELARCWSDLLTASTKSRLAKNGPFDVGCFTWLRLPCLSVNAMICPGLLVLRFVGMSC